MNSSQDDCDLADDVTLLLPSSLSKKGLALKLLANSRLIYWIACYSTMRGTHTLFVMLWGILSSAIAPSEAMQRYNGLITCLAYGVAAVVVLLVARFERRLHARPVLWTVIGYSVSGVMLLTMPLCPNLAFYALLHVIYNAFSEATLALVVTQAAWAVKDTVAPHPHLLQVAYVFSMGLRFMTSLTVQALLQLSLYPTWGSVNNIFALQLDIRAQFKALGIVILFAGAVAAAAIGIMPRQVAADVSKLYQ